MSRNSAILTSYTSDSHSVFQLLSTQNVSYNIISMCILTGSLLIQAQGLPRWLSGKEPACQCRRCRFNPWVGNILWRRKWKPTLVFLPGKSHGQRSLVGNNPWGSQKVEHNLVTDHKIIQAHKISDDQRTVSVGQQVSLSLQNAQATRRSFGKKLQRHNSFQSLFPV